MSELYPTPPGAKPIYYDVRLTHGQINVLLEIAEMRLTPKLLEAIDALKKATRASEPKS